MLDHLRPAFDFGLLKGAELFRRAAGGFDRKVGEQYVKYAHMLAGRGFIQSSLGNMAIRAPHPKYPDGVCYVKPNGVSLEEIEVDEPGPQEVRVRTVACGVCHSDLHFMQGNIAGPRPTVPGHEPAGIVDAVGSEVRSVKPGDHVIC